MTTGSWFYNDGSGEENVSLEWDADPDQAAGYGVGFAANGDPIIQPVSLTDVTDPGEQQTPFAPALTGAMPSRTSVHLAWVAADNTGRPAVTGWQVEVRSSTDNGSSFGGWGAITGSPFAAVATTADLSSLSVGTPEVLREYRARGVNADGPGQYSNVVRLQWSTTPPARPTAPTNFRDQGAPTTITHDVAWNAATDPSGVTPIDKYGIFVGQTTAVDPTSPLVDNIDPNLLDEHITGLSPGQPYSNVNVRAHNAQGWSPASNRVSWTQPTEVPPAFTILMGCSDSDNDHGGTEEWDVWRCYTRGAMLARANATGARRPVALAYSANGTSLGYGQGDPVGASTYNAIFNYVKSELDSFYYGGTGQTHTARWGIKLYWSVGGNENYDKAPLSANSTAAQIGDFVTVMRASWDAAHLVDPVTGQRRYPDAYVGSNPTQEHERLGYVAAPLAAAAQYHDFLVWSMYPPGRGVNDPTLSRNPRWDFPTFTESQRQNRQPGFLIRCFYRTKQAEIQARADSGDQSRRIIIGCGETGMASDPDDRSTRPYYAVHALAGSMWQLARQYALQMDFACWWDNKTADTAPHNVLTDEQPNSDHLAQATGAADPNTNTTNPSTATAWRNWLDYDKRQPGSSQPAQWAGKPQNIDNFTGTLI